jgi:hypothetical protein
VALAAIVACLASGCATTLVPPSEVRDPATVILLDHGGTASLVLPNQDAGMVRFGYGDWNYYALRRTSLGDGIAALFWPTQAALGRRRLNGPVTTDSVRSQVAVPIEAAHEITVERSATVRLREDLEALFAQNLDTLVVTPSVDFEFVHHPAPYTLAHNSNHVVAEWLRSVGVRTHGPAWYSEWKVEAGATEIRLETDGKE